MSPWFIHPPVYARPRWTRPVHSLLVLLAVCALTSSVHGQSADAPEPERDTRTNEDVEHGVKESMRVGIEAYRRKDFEGARQAYEKAWTLKEHTAIAAALAEVETKLGHYLAAAEHWKFYLANVPAEHGKPRALAEQQLAECLKHLGRVRLELNVSGAVLAIGPRQIGTAPTSQEVLVEPGTHEIRVERTGYEQEVKQLSVAAGETAEIRIELKPLTTTPPPAPPPAHKYEVLPTSDSKQTTRLSPRTVVVIGGAALTITALTLGTVFQLRAASLEDDVEKARQRTQSTGDPTWVAASGQCNPAAPNRPVADCQALTDKVDDLDRSGTTARVAFIAAGALGAATVATFFLWPSDASRAARADKGANWSVTSFPGARVRGIQVHGRF